MAVLQTKPRANDVFAYLIRRSVPKDEMLSVVAVLQPVVPGIKKIERLAERVTAWLSTWDEEE